LYFSRKNYQAKLWSCFTKVVWFFTRNPKKLSLNLSDFPMIFYAFYKIANDQTLFKNHFTQGSLDVFLFLHICPQYAIKSPERLKASQCGPWPWPRWLRPNPGEVSRGNGGEGLRAHLGRVCFPAYASARLHRCRRLMIGCLHEGTSLSHGMQKMPPRLALEKREWNPFLRSHAGRMQHISKLMMY
jgi:hypothetical protein